MNEGIETIAGKERAPAEPGVPAETVPDGSVAAGQTTAEIPGDAEPADPEFLQAVVVGLIEGNKGRRTHVKEIVYALTLKKTVPKSLFNVIRRELNTIEETGSIIHVGRGKYKSPGDLKRSQEAGKTARSSRPPAPKPQTRPRRRTSREKQQALEEKIREAFKDSYHVVPPRKTRREQRRKK